MLLTLSKFFLYLSLLSVVIVMPSIFFPFIGGKYYFFRVTVELALMFALLWWAFEAQRGHAEALIRGAMRRPLVVAVSLFALAFLLATIFAYDPNGAFWSNYERGDGGFQMLHYYAFFMLLALLFDGWNEWRKAFFVSLIAAGAMILYGTFGYISLTERGNAFFCPKVKNEEGILVERCWMPKFITPYQGGQMPETFWGRLKPGASETAEQGKTIYEPGILASARFQGSLGNPAYVAPYLLFSLFFAFFLWAKGSARDGRGDSLLRGIGYGGLAAVFLFFFTLSQTRGAFLGLASAILAFLAYLFFVWQRGRVRVGAVLAGILIIGGILFAFREASFVKSLPGSRFLDLKFSEQTVNTRLWTWGSAWRGFLERPILGWGPENFSTVFDRHFDPRHYIPGKNSETWFDRAHSVFFDYLTGTGILGLLSYLGMFAVFYLEFFKKVARRAQHNADKSRFSEYAPYALLFSLPIAYLVQGLALFDVLPIYLNLFLFLAFADYLVRSIVPRTQ